MEEIVTITPNPAIDICTTVAEIAPVRKLRCTAARRDPGGGGINVARVIRRLGTEASAIYPAGGATGNLLQRLVERERVRSIAIAVAEETREDFTVLDRKSGDQFRFVLPGSELAESEWKSCITPLEEMAPLPRFVVASGSLPPGVPADFYARVADVVRQRGSKIVLDTAGVALSKALEGGVYLLKPNLRELQELTATVLERLDERVAACRRLVDAGSSQIVVLTMGEEGALLVTREGAYTGHAPELSVVSAVGAGDSFVGGMVWKLMGSGSVVEAFRCGVAAGSAAVLNPGTELAHAEDILRLYDQIEAVPV